MTEFNMDHLCQSCAGDPNDCMNCWQCQSHFDHKADEYEAARERDLEQTLKIEGQLIEWRYMLDDREPAPTPIYNEDDLPF